MSLLSGSAMVNLKTKPLTKPRTSPWTAIFACAWCGCEQRWVESCYSLLILNSSRWIGQRNKQNVGIRVRTCIRKSLKRCHPGVIASDAFSGDPCYRSRTEEPLIIINNPCRRRHNSFCSFYSLQYIAVAKWTIFFCLFIILELGLRSVRTQWGLHVLRQYKQ